MAVNVETLEKLGRKVTVLLPVDDVQKEMMVRLRRLSKSVKMSGFRPGKIPMNVMVQQYGYSVEQEVLKEKLGEAFFKLTQEADLKVAGAPSFKQKSEDAPEGQMAFDAEFEVFPEVKVKDLSKAKIEKIDTKVDDASVDKTVDVLRRQRSTFNQRPAAEAAAEGDRATVDFEGKIDGEAFAGGKAENYAFVLGEGQMLKEFEDAVLGMKVGETKTFQLTFPEDYHGKEVAGKQSDFLITLKKLEERVMPEVNDDFAKALGVGEGTVAGLKEDIRKNLEREVKARVLRRNKEAVMDVLVANSELDLPSAIVKSEIQNMIQGAREEMRARGMKDIDKMPVPEELFKEQAERRVRLGLIVSELVKEHKLEATADQIKAHIDDLAASYEKPEEVVRWYYSDANRLAEVEGIVLEANVTDYVLGKAKVSEKEITFDELMERQ